MLIGSAIELTITAIISLTTIKKPTNKQIPPIIRKKAAHSSHFSFKLDNFMLALEKKLIFLIEKTTRCQILHLKKFSVSHFELKKIQRVRF